ncbi:MAG TPA: alcohol dehydrogenase catalytic domain-containing protein [Gaiellaceae bacterium]
MRGLTKLAPGPGNVEISERPEPSAAPAHVVLDVVAAGICGTDLHIYDGEYASLPPVTMGHEVSGVVAELGEGVDDAWRGARVVTETYFSTCGRCMFCRGGRINLCPERRSIGSFVDGGFAPRLHVPARNLHRIPDWLDGRVAAMTEPLACCCQSLLNPERVGAGDGVLVVGPGPIGLLAAQVARAAGGDVHVRGTPRDAARLDAAARLGFTTSTTDDGPAGDFDVVVECSGHEAGMTFALESARRGARYVQIGLAGKPVSVPVDLVCFRELTVTSGNASTPASWERALELIGDRRVDLEPLFSGAVPLADWEQAFAATRSGAGIKYVLVP